MKTDTISTASKQAILTLLQNSSLQTALIQAVIALQSPHVPKSQLRISQFLKDVKNDMLQIGSDECVVGEPIRNDENKEQIEQFRNLLSLLRQVSEKEDSEQRNLKKFQKPKQNFDWFTNIVEDSNYWNLVGIQMHDAPLVQKSLALFRLNHPHLKHIRFVGKIFGLERNYYVIETDHDLESHLETYYTAVGNYSKVYFGQTEQPAENAGARGTTNHYRYWISTSGEALSKSEWVRLPDVTPAQILTAKSIKKYFTGRLDAPVDSYPEFPGNEANYLRAQIARIVAATTVAPANLYKLWAAPEEDDDSPKELIVPPVSDIVLNKGEDTEEDEASVLNVKTLQLLENWIHLYPVILDVGRATPYKPPKVKSEDDEEEEVEEEEEDENRIPRLRALNSDSGMKLPDYLKPEVKEKKEDDEEEPEEADEDEDAPMKGTYPSWTFEAFGDHDEMNAIVLARSLRWPGAYAYAAENGKRASMIYIGDGQKVEGDLNVFTPLIPEPIQQEQAEPKQIDDPSVSNEKRVRDFGEEPLKNEEEEEGEGEED